MSQTDSILRERAGRSKHPIALASDLWRPIIRDAVHWPPKLRKRECRGGCRTFFAGVAQLVEHNVANVKMGKFATPYLTRISAFSPGFSVFCIWSWMVLNGREWRVVVVVRVGKSALDFFTLYSAKLP